MVNPNEGSTKGTMILRQSGRFYKVIKDRKEVNLKSVIIDFLWQLKKQNRFEDTIKAYGYALNALVNIGVNLGDPQSCLEKMPSQTQWSETRKYNLTKAYRCFLNENKIKAMLPK